MSKPFDNTTQSYWLSHNILTNYIRKTTKSLDIDTSEVKPWESAIINDVSSVFDDPGVSLSLTRAKVLAHKVLKVVSISLNAFERRTESARSELLYDPAINRCVGRFLCTLIVV